MPNMNLNRKKGEVIPLLLNSSFFYKKAIKAYEDQRLDQAIFYIKRAIQLDQDEPVFPCQLAIFYAEKGLYEDANKLLENVVHEIDRSMYECYFFMANNYAHLGKFSLAIHYTNKYLEKEPEGEFANDAHSLLQLLNDEFFAEIDEWSDLDEVMKYGHILEPLHRGDFALAEKKARMTIAESPKEWDVYAYLAETLMLQGELDEAKTILENLLKKTNSHFLARCLYTTLLVKEENDEGKLWVDSLKNVYPLNDWHSYYLAKTLFIVGEYEKANEWFEKLAHLHSFNHSPIFLHQRAVVACKNGQDEMAKNLWEKIKVIDKNNEIIAEHFITLLEGKKLFTFTDEQLFIYAHTAASK